MKSRFFTIICILLAFGGCSLDDPIECTDQATKCIDEQGVGKLYTCEGTKWGESVICEGSARCAENGKECQPPDCEPGARRCTNTDGGGVISICSEEHHWGNSTSCRGGLPCLNDSECKEPERCTKDETKCTNTDSGGILQTCNAQGEWGDQSPCRDNLKCQDAYICASNACTPGTTQCKNNSVDGVQFGNLFQCNEEGRWGAAVACSGNAACKDGTSCGEPQVVDKCADKPDRCQPIEGVGIGQIIHCEEGDYTFTNCPNNTPCKDELECAECKDGQQQCKDGKMYSCQEGSFVESEVCETNTCYDETRCQRCTKSCTNNEEGIGQLIIACEGHENSPQSCSNVSCNADGTDCGECKDSEALSCTNDSDNLGHLSGCFQGKLYNDTPCPNQYACKYTMDACADCAENSVRCVGEDGNAKLQVCIDGVYGGKDTRFSVACPGVKRCKNELACEGYDSICAYLRPGNPFGTTLYSNGTFRECGSVSCNSDKTDCGNCSMNPSGPSTTCSNNADGIGLVSGCVNGEKVDKKPCDKDYSCNASYNCGECRNGDWKCEVDGTGTGLISICVNGSWSYRSYEHTRFSCPSGKVCSKTGCEDDAQPLCANDSNGRGAMALKRADGRFSIYHCKQSCSEDLSDCICETTNRDFRCKEDASGQGILYGCNGTMNGKYFWGDGPDGEPHKYSCSGGLGCNERATFCRTSQDHCVQRTNRPLTVSGYMASYSTAGVTLTDCKSVCNDDGTCTQ